MKKLPILGAILLTWMMLMSPLAESAAAPGETLNLANYEGKVVVLDFWASWCVPCRRSFPWLNEMHKKYAQDDLVIIGVNVDQDQDDAAAFLDKYPAQFRISYDPNGVLAKAYDVRGMPSSFVIGRDGQLAAQHLGFKVKRQDEYEAAIVAALQQEISK